AESARWLSAPAFDDLLAAVERRAAVIAMMAALVVQVEGRGRRGAPRIADDPDLLARHGPLLCFPVAVALVAISRPGFAPRSPFLPGNGFQDRFVAPKRRNMSRPIFSGMSLSDSKALERPSARPTHQTR